MSDELFFNVKQGNKVSNIYLLIHSLAFQQVVIGTLLYAINSHTH